MNVRALALLALSSFDIEDLDPFDDDLVCSDVEHTKGEATGALVVTVPDEVERRDVHFTQVRVTHGEVGVSGEFSSLTFEQPTAPGSYGLRDLAGRGRYWSSLDARDEDWWSYRPRSFAPDGTVEVISVGDVFEANVTLAPNTDEAATIVVSGALHVVWQRSFEQICVPKPEGDGPCGGCSCRGAYIGGPN